MDITVGVGSDSQRRRVVQPEATGAGRASAIGRHRPIVVADGQIARQRQTGAGGSEGPGETGGGHGDMVNASSPDRRPFQRSRTGGEDGAIGRSYELTNREVDGQVVVRG